MKAKYQKPYGAVVNLRMDLTVPSSGSGRLTTSGDGSRMIINGPAPMIEDNRADVAEGRAPRPHR